MRPGSSDPSLMIPGSPERIRTAASALRGRRPRPLDDGARTRTSPPYRSPLSQLGGEELNPQLQDQNLSCCRLHHPRMGAPRSRCGR